MIPLSYNVRNLRVRKTTSAAAVLGLALVVFIFASVQMLANGITRTLGRSAAPDVAVVLRKGSTAEIESNIEAPDVNVVLFTGPSTPIALQAPRTKVVFPVPSSPETVTTSPTARRWASAAAIRSVSDGSFDS